MAPVEITELADDDEPVMVAEAISDWDELPPRTKIIVGYRNNGKVSSAKPPSKIAGGRYKHHTTVYYFPNTSLVTGNTVKSFKTIPTGVQVYLPVKKS